MICILFHHSYHRIDDSDDGYLGSDINHSNAAKEMMYSGLSVPLRFTVQYITAQRMS